MSSSKKKKFAIISVSDKKDIQHIAKKLIENGFHILSTGGTAKFLTSHKIPNESISEFTSFDEILEGRVKTLHPKIHAGILAKSQTDLSKIKNSTYQLIDIVIVNLYPFEKVTSDPSCKHNEAIENIDIGGPTLLRASAKNYKRVTVITDPGDYQKVISEVEEFGTTTLETRYMLASKVFSRVSEYDSMIMNYFEYRKSTKSNELPSKLNIIVEERENLRYGENPHQKAKLYRIKTPAYKGFDYKQVSGKSLSFNNLVDSESALACVKQFTNPACVIVKHANPCGVSESTSLSKAYKNAYTTDPTSAFGGIIAFNRTLDHKLLNKILGSQFVEVIIAPSMAEACKSVLIKKPNVRVLLINGFKNKTKSFEFKSLKNHFLLQESDTKTITKKDLKCVTKKRPSKRELEDLIFATKVARYVKSNSIVFVKNKRTLGIGAGQMSRIDSTNIAKSKAVKYKINLKGSVMASEAFFPFRDNIDLAKKIGVSSIIQPGGSIKDLEIISITDKYNISMVFSGTRVFKH